MTLSCIGAKDRLTVYCFQGKPIDNIGKRLGEKDVHGKPNFFLAIENYFLLAFDIG